MRELSNKEINEASEVSGGCIIIKGVYDGFRAVGTSAFETASYLTNLLKSYFIK